MQNFTLFPGGDLGLVPKEGGNENFRLGNFFLFWEYFGHFIFSSHAALHVAYVGVAVCLSVLGMGKN